MRLKLLSLAALLTALTGCEIPQPSTPLYSEYPTPLHPVDKGGADAGFQKTFETQSDWQGNGWVVKQGASIQFNADGTGVFTCIVYTNPGINLPNAIQFQSLQFGSDGNLLFGTPGSDVGQSLHLRTPMRDYPYTMRFGYNQDYYPHIQTVKFMGRLLCGSDPRGEQIPATTTPPAAK